MRKPKLYVVALFAAVLALLVAGCGGDDDEGDEGGGEEVSGSVELSGVWTGEEAKSFNAVLDGFTEQNPDVDVKYRPVGDEIPTVLATSVEGGNPPDLAAVPQPGLVEEFVDKGALQPLDFVEDDLNENYNPGAIDIATFDGKVYGFLFKAANKSLVWYNVQSYSDAGVEPADDWDTWLKNGDTLSASGTAPYSIGGADGWTLTDLFENIYLRSAGPEKYDQLATHDIPWTDQSVKDALTTMADVLQSDKIAGGTESALQTDFPTSVTQVFSDPPKAAQVIEGDFVAGVIADSTKAEPKTGFDVFPFPSINDSPQVVVGGGDTVVMFKDSPAAEALVKYLASPEAAEIWAAKGGFASLNKNMDTSVYPDEITQTTAGALADVETFRFDLSDLQPAEFGGTVGQGLFKLFQDFLKNPKDVDGISQQMEDAAAKAYGG